MTSAAPLASTPPSPAGATAAEPGQTCSSDKDCAGSRCAELSCAAGRCQIVKARGDYSDCGSGDEPRKCFQGSCYEPAECAAQCGRQLARQLAADLVATFPHCKGPKASECRWKTLEPKHPIVVKTEARAEACMVDCGYPSLELPASVP